MQTLNSEQQFNKFFQVSKEAILALFLLFNYLLFLAISSLLSSSYYESFVGLASILLYAIAVTLNLVFIYKVIKALPRAVVLFPVLFFRLCFLLLLLYFNLPMLVDEQAVSWLSSEYLWLLVLLTIEWFFIKALFLQEQNFTQLAEKFKLSGFQRSNYLYVVMVLLLTGVIVAFDWQDLIISSSSFFTLILLSQIFAYLLILPVSLFPLAKFLDKYHARIVNHDFWPKLNKIKRVVLLIDSLDLPGHVRLQRIELLDSRADRAAVEALLLRFSEHYQGEFGNAIARGIKTVPHRFMPQLDSVQLFEDGGAWAVCDGESIFLGQEKFLIQNSIPLQASELGQVDAGSFCLYLAVNKHPVARLHFAERLMADGIDLKKALATQGIVTEVACCYENLDLHEALESISEGELKRTFYSSKSDYYEKNKSTAIENLEVATSEAGSAALNITMLNAISQIGRTKSDFELLRADLLGLAKLIVAYRRYIKLRRVFIALIMLIWALLAWTIYWPHYVELSTILLLSVLNIAAFLATLYAWRYNKQELV